MSLGLGSYINFDLTNLPKYRFIDRMLMDKLTKKDLTEFYCNHIQPSLKRMDSIDAYDLEKVKVISGVVDGKVTYSFRFYDTGEDDCLITFSLFEFTGECYYSAKIKELTNAWQDLLVKILGNKYKTLLLKHYKRIFDEEQNAIDEEIERLEKNRKHSIEKYKAVKDRFGEVSSDDLQDDTINVD